jgi:molecular chaperone HtpG
VEVPREYGLHISLYLVSGNNFENKVKLDTSLPSQELGQKIIIVGPVSINGILCLTSMFFEDRKVVLWNPAIDELKVIPPSPVESVTPYRVFLPQIHGFGYDGVRDDYKVLRYVQFDTDTLAHGLSDEHVVWNEISYEPLWEIYSLRNNSWRKLDIKMPMLMVSFGDVEIV